MCIIMSACVYIYNIYIYIKCIYIYIYVHIKIIYVWMDACMHVCMNYVCVCVYMVLFAGFNVSLGDGKYD